MNCSWSEEEKAFLKKRIEIDTFPELVKGLGKVSRRSSNLTRTTTAVSHQLFLMKLSRKASRAYFLSVEDVRTTLKIAVRRVKGWIEEGLEVSKSSDKPRAHHFIHVNDLEAFALGNPSLFAGIAESDLVKILPVESAKEIVRNSKRELKKRKVRCVGGFSYASINEAARAIRVSPSTLRSSILAGRPVNGRYWEFID